MNEMDSVIFLYKINHGNIPRKWVVRIMVNRPANKYISFGTWRFFLASLVAISHLWAGMIEGYAAYAVWGFFVLSGYLMTYVLRNKYGFDFQGLKAYAFNRFLRIMPSYWAVLILGIITIVVLTPLGIDLPKLNPQFAMPHGREWLFPLTLLPIFIGSNIPVPVANALGVEVGVYILIPFMAQHRSAAWLGMLLGLFINYQYGFGVPSFPARYSEFLPCFLPFAIGSLVAHYINQLRRFSYPRLSWLVWIIHGLLWFKFGSWPWTYGLYFSIILSSWVVVSMDTDRSSSLDKFLGDLSYPVYLIHTTVAAWLLGYYGYTRTFSFFAWSFLGTLFLSWMIIILVDKPLLPAKKLSNKKPIQEGINANII